MEISTSKNGTPFIETEAYLIIIKQAYVVLKNKQKNESEVVNSAAQLKKSIKKFTPIGSFEKDLLDFVNKVFLEEVIWVDGKYIPRTKPKAHQSP